MDFINISLSPNYQKSILSSCSSLYCLLTITIYTVIIINKFATLNLKNNSEIEANNLLLYMLLVSCLFLLYLLLVLKKPPNSHSNKKSHGSAFLRQGATVFGFGTAVYLLFTIISYISDFECVGSVVTINSILALIFVILQTFMIDLYPRLNLDQGYGIPHFGLMHIVSTNLILWIRTVVRESIMEFHEANEKAKEHDSESHLSIEPIHAEKHLSRMHYEQSCQPLAEHNSHMYRILRASSPILFAFIIEFSLIGATVFFQYVAEC